MCVRVCVRVCVCACTYEHANVYANVCAYACTYASVQVCVCEGAHVPVCVCVSVFMCMRVCAPLRVRAHGVVHVERGSSVVECWTRNQVSPGSNPPLLPFRRLGIFVPFFYMCMHVCARVGAHERAFAG